MESQGQGLEEIGALLVHGGKVGAEGTEGIGAVFGSEAARDFLFDLGHSNGLFGDIVGERDIVVGGKAPDIVGVIAQAEQEVCRLALSRLAAPAGFRGERIHGFTVGEEFFITRPEACDALRGKRTTQFVHLVTGRPQQVDHAAGPGLSEFLEDVGQFAQMMGIAQPVFAEQFTIGLQPSWMSVPRKWGRIAKASNASWPRFG